MNCDVLIRKAVLSDADEIRNITREAFAGYAAKTTARRIDALEETAEDIKYDITNKIVLAAEQNGKLCGSLRLDISDKTAYLTRFAVKAENRKCGIGSTLMKYADRVMLENGVCELCLHTDLNMKPLIGFYERMGFSVKASENTRGYTRALLSKKYPDE